MSFLPQADLILVLVDGEISERGSYQELLNRNGAFADFIHTFVSSERKECFSEASQRGNITVVCVQAFILAENIYMRFLWMLVTPPGYSTRESSVTNNVVWCTACFSFVALLK